MSHYLSRRGLRWRPRLAGSLAAVALCLVAGSPAAAASAAGGRGLTLARSDVAPPPAFQRSFNGAGQAALVDPAGIAVGADGDVWVADGTSDRIEEFSTDGRLAATFDGTGSGALSGPVGIAVSAGGDIWVADAGHDRIVEFSPHGTELRSFGSAGRGKGQLSGPRDLVVAPDGDIYVADQGNNRIEKFSQSGVFLASITVASPYGIALDAAGNIWVSSPSYADGNAVYEYSPSGSRLQQYGTTQADYGSLSNPAGIAIGPAGRIYIAQPDFGWVTVLNSNGSYDTEFGLTSAASQTDENLRFPQDLAITAAGQVWVADSGNGRVVEFGALPAGAAPGHPPVPVLLWLVLIVLAALILGALALLGARLRRRRTRPSAGPAQTSQAQASLAGHAAGVTRRRLLTGATLLTGAAAGAAGGSVLPLSLRAALASTLASPPRARLSDIKHIVILMQENRSFDHYFGTMPGVRGFADPAAIMLPGGKPVFFQPDPSHPQGYLLPFHYDTATTSAQATPSTDHSWPTQHQAWNHGKMDSWIAAKGEYTMGYFTAADIPFQWALAQAFTLCDNYHCSVLGPTNPNRLYLWTGMIDPAGAGGGPVIDNTPAFNNVTLSWTTYPERLERASISWQVYQEEDNYDDNALAWFRQYGSAPSSSALHQRGMIKLPAGAFEADARADRLPQVSWLIAPTAQSEHPDYFPAAGAEYIAQKLDAIASNPDVWAKTAFILCYDENDGLFDHVVPPTPAARTPAEFVGAEPIGLGFRTPTTIVSPWTAGGLVCSDVFDHTSLIRFIEARFGVREPNISASRRQTCGDLTSAFRFGSGPAGFPLANPLLRLSGTEARLLTAQREVADNPSPAIPGVNLPLPRS